MALQPLSATRLAETVTVFGPFMGHADRSPKTVGQLLAIYRESRPKVGPAQDAADHLRVERFIRDMAANRWRDDLAVQIGVFGGIVRVIDGIHRSIAYLACIEDGIRPDRLPALHVHC